MFSSLTYSTPYDLLGDFEPIALLTIAPMAIYGRIGLPGTNLKELVAWMKDNPDKLSFGSVGVGGPARVWAADFQDKIGTRLQFVPYRGAVAAAQDLVGGQIDLSAGEGTNALNLGRSGKVKIYAMLSEERWSVAPDCRPSTETGVPGLNMPFGTALGAQGHAARGDRKAQRRSGARAG